MSSTTRRRRGVASFKVSDHGGIEYRFHDKSAALEKACRIFGLYARDHGQKADPLTTLLRSLSGNVLGITSNLDPDDD